MRGQHAAMLVGIPDRPIDAKHTAVIRLHYVNDMDKQSCPAIICCGGRMDFHGAPMNRTWVKLGATANGQRKLAGRNFSNVLLYQPAYAGRSHIPRIP